MHSIICEYNKAQGNKQSTDKNRINGNKIKRTKHSQYSLIYTYTSKQLDGIYQNDQRGSSLT